MKNIAATILLLFIYVFNSQAQNKDLEFGKHIFDNPPDSIPKIFAKGIISLKDRYEYGLAISPGYDEMFFTAEKPGNGLMVMRKSVDGAWTKPEVANLRGNKSWEQSAFYTPDGGRIYFSSNDHDSSHIWFCSKEKDGWSHATCLKSLVNYDRASWATVANSGAMYYTNLHFVKIFKAFFEDNQYKKVDYSGVLFGIHPTISKDESFILVDYRGDIYVAFKNKSEKWGKPVKLGGLINTARVETCPSLSPDEKYIFFSRNSELNGKSDIYWVSSKTVEELRKKVAGK